MPTQCSDSDPSPFRNPPAQLATQLGRWVVAAKLCQDPILSYFRIADTFTDSSARLTGDEQKAVKATAFDLQLNSANPGMSFQSLNNKAKDKNFWSVRVSGNIR